MIKRMMTVAPLMILIPFAQVQANECKLLPVMNDDYNPDFAVTIIGDKTDFKNGDDVTTRGVEVSLNYPLLKPPHLLIF